MTNVVLSINPALAVKVGQLSDSLSSYGESSYLFKWLFSNKASKPEKSSAPIAGTPALRDAAINSYSRLALDSRALFLTTHTESLVWRQVYDELDRLIDLEIKNKYKANLSILTDVRPFITTTVKELLQLIDADPTYTPALIAYFGVITGSPNGNQYGQLTNPMFVLSNQTTGAEEELNDLIEVLAEYTMHSFYEEWIGAHWKAGVSTVPICVYESSAMITTRKDHHTKMEFIKTQAFRNAPGGWEHVLLACRESVKSDALNHHLPPVYPGPPRQPLNILDIKAYCRNKAHNVIQTFVGDPKYEPMFARYFGKHYDKTKLTILANASLNVSSYPMSDRLEIEHAYSFWSSNVSIAFDNQPIKDAVNFYFEQIDKLLVPQFVQDGAARKKVLNQIGDWYKDAISNPADKLLQGLGTQFKDYSHAFDVSQFGAEVKAIVGSPVTRIGGLTTSISTSLSILRNQAPVFAHDADAWSSAVVLLVFSSDVSSSVILSLVVLFVMFGYEKQEIGDILSGLGQPEFSRVYPQIHELLKAGAAFPSEVEKLIRDVGLNDINLNQGIDKVVGEWMGKAIQPFTDAAVSFKASADVIRNTVVGTTDKVVNILTSIGKNPKADEKTAVSGVIPPSPLFDNWFQVFSLAALLGPFNDALNLTAKGLSTTFKEMDKTLGTIEKVYDQPSVFIQNITRVSDDIDSINNTRLDVLHKAGNLLIDATAGVKSPQFGALAVPLVKGGTEKLRFIINDMIINSPDRPAELDAPYGMIIPIIIVGSSTLLAPVEKLRDGLFKMFTITEIKPPVLPT